MIIRLLSDGADAILLPSLADLLMEAVEDGASVSFLAGLSHEDALVFWAMHLKAAAAGSQAVLAAISGDDSSKSSVLGVVIVDFAMPQNQPHRAELQKLIVTGKAQRAGVGAALLARAEAEAQARGRWLLVLDTVAGSPAARLYSRCGWQKVGDIPAFALLPHGGYAPTTIYFKRL